MPEYNVSTDKSSLTVYVLGLRGFPDVQGGVETHAENLYPIIQGDGVSVTCATRSPFHDENIKEWRDVKFIRIWAPRSSYLEAIVHSVLAALRAAILRPDVVHIHAVGPSLVAPLARLMGLRVVVTHHGPDYDREKWNPFAKFVLRCGEWAGMRFANHRIVISQVIADMVREKYGVESSIIPNGVPIPALDADSSVLRQFGLEPEKYVVLVSRFVPEKRHLDLIEAFTKAALPGWKLALVGDADHPGEYVEKVREAAAETQDVILTGFQTGNVLKALYQHAGVFVLPSSHEGLPISLLEALSYGLRCVASSIPAHMCIDLADDVYFDLGDTDDLAEKIRLHAQIEWFNEDRDRVRRWVADNYDWADIAKDTIAVYREAAA
jgi:glycosyltransferase involved in cell wall biosynthesis